MQLDRIIQPPQHTDSRRMHPTTQLNAPNSHTKGTPESRRCSWSNPLPRECSRSCLLVMVLSAAVGLLGDTLIENFIATATSLPSGFLRSHPLVIPCSYMLALTTDKHRGSLTPFPTHRALAKRSPYIPLRAVIPYFVLFYPISLILNNNVGIRQNEKSKQVYRELYC